MDLSLNVRWPSEANALFDELEQKKLEAVGQNTSLWRSTALGMAMVRASGRKPIYRFRFVVPDLEFFVAKQLEPKRAPNVQASISARLLWDVGAMAATERVHQVIAELGGQVTASWPTRCDLCADFLFDEPLSFDFIRQARVSRATKIRRFLDGETLESIYIGAGGAPIQCRIYDKGLEIMSKGKKFWMAEVWKVDSVAGVWRVEFQIRREVNQFGIGSVDSLLANASAIWRNLTGEWLSLRMNDSSNTPGDLCIPGGRPFRAVIN